MTLAHPFPDISAKALVRRDHDAMQQLRHAVSETGFFLLSDTDISGDTVRETLALYEAFFKSPAASKQSVDMAVTGSNRGWGRPRSEQVDPEANPDYKEVFDCGVEVAADDPRADLSVYAPNLWPSQPAGFRDGVEDYFRQARGVAMGVLTAIEAAIDVDDSFFAGKFDKPMALLRGNYYPQRPADATERDFGIAAHTDYGCMTLLATDGQPGLEVKLKDGTWAEASAQPGTFVINFGEMLERWSGGKIKATLHRVVGGNHERLSLPLFFNPNYDTNIAGPSETAPMSAGDYLTQRYNETYVHLQDSKAA
ncbi:MAG: 2-oxoglutarate and iron-dependent oxygenase domain-containing protein [Pseudomonadota bacterium]